LDVDSVGELTIWHGNEFIQRNPYPRPRKHLISQLFLLENWRRPSGRPRTTWMKTIQQDLRS